MKKHKSGANELLQIAASLRDQAHKADPGPTWRDKAIAALANPDMNEGILRSAQILRDAGALSKDEAFHRITLCAESMIERRLIDNRQADPEIARIDQAIKAAEKAHGLPADQYWPRGEAPDDVEKLQDEWERRFDAIMADVLREHGEAAMADLLMTDRKAFHDQCAAGRLKTFGPLPEYANKK